MEGYAASPPRREWIQWMPFRQAAVPQVIAVLSDGAQATSYRETSIELFLVDDGDPRSVWKAFTVKESTAGLRSFDSTEILFDSDGISTRRIATSGKSNTGHDPVDADRFQRFRWNGTTREFVEEHVSRDRPSTRISP
jgi:hypothetical protein